MKRESREWLGIAPADFPVYVAFIFVVVLYFNNGTVLDVILSVSAFVLSVVACIIGMRKEPEVSGFTNVIKKISYPACLLVCLVLIYVNFAVWNSP
jgi:hypothetical protein